MQDYIPRKIDINENMAAVTVKQFDNKSRFLHVQITDRDLTDDEGAPFNMVECEVRLYVERPGREPEYIDGEIADGENGIITFTLPNSVTQADGDYDCEIWITNPADGAVISTKPFLLRVEKSIRNDDALEAGESFSALENALLRVAVDRARLDNLAAMANSANAAPGTVDSEVLDIRTGHDGTTYATAGNAVREQIREIKDSVATTAEFLSVVGGEYSENEQAAALISDLKAVLENAAAFQTQIDNLGREIGRIVEFIPNGGITEGKLGDGAVSAEKLSPALKRPSVVTGAGTVAAMLGVAESYFNYAYTADGRDGGILYESHTGLYSDSLGGNAENAQYGMVCSSFVEAVLNAISFENSRYNGKESNAGFSWGAAFDDTVPFGSTDNPTSTEIRNKYLTSQALAKYAAKHGWLYAVDGSERVRAGDLLFSGDTEGRYLGIDHVALVLNADDTYCTLLEAWPSQKTDIDGTKRDVGLRINYRVPISDYTCGAVFPLGDVGGAPAVMESVYDTAGDTESSTVIHEFRGKAAQGFYTVVCHGKLGGAPYVSLKYDGAGENTMQGVMHCVGDDYYLTVYVQKPAVISFRMTKGSTYDISELSLYRGYAEMTARSSFGVRLNAGDDLDDCLDGVWYCRNTDTARNILHAPLGDNAEAGFRLEAVRMTNGERYRQTVWYVGKPDKMYVRMYISSGWTVWVAYSGTAV